MTRDRIAAFIASKRFKRILFYTGLAFIVLTFILALNPAPFLRYGYAGVFVFALFGPASLLVPVLARYMNVPALAVVTASGMAINDSVSWYVGSLGAFVLPPSTTVLRLEKSLRSYGKFALFFWALIPFPFDIVGLIAGYSGFSFAGFIVPIFLGRLLRFLLLGYGVLGLRSMP